MEQKRSPNPSSIITRLTDTSPCNDSRRQFPARNAAQAPKIHPRQQKSKKTKPLETVGEARQSKASETQDIKIPEIRENRTISTLELAAKDVRMVMNNKGNGVKP
jgi:hypothetical protein